MAAKEKVGRLSRLSIMQPRVSFCLVSATLIVGLQAAQTVAAQEDLTHVKRGSVVFAAFSTEPDTHASFTSSTGIEGSDIDLESDLGLDTTRTIARLGGYYWFSLHHRLDFSAFRLSRDSSKVLDKTIEFGDQTFLVNRQIEASSDVTILKTDYTFAPIVRERGIFGITAGIYTADVDLGIRERTSDTEESESFTAPLPVLGVRGQFRIMRRLSLEGSYERFSIATGDTDGTLNDSYLGLDYSFNDRIALGVAYNVLTVDVDNQPGPLRHRQFDWGYDGFLLYLKANFGS